ncbi:serine/threonine-protein kinase Nek4-like [Pomacea canaliculata]|uniref:serine/threonine-protein kinase Nek4-like n=1 Tax=Pomacea canaliculata TaxID=400727 RepID=UPI000D735F2A|nr:serine/threonine-protein kinase Nek4-like [Pomacea canaliculata]
MMEQFERQKVIGKGSYGEVWLAQHKTDKKQYVLKRINLKHASVRERKSAEQEAKLLSKLKHPNIVSYKDSFESSEGLLYIAMQYCEGGDLYTRLKEQKGNPLEERQVVEWFVQIAMALQYMHERNILHRDLKTQNIFLTKSRIIKVGDLGIARVLENSNDMATTLIGTPYYMSPELFSNKPYNHKSDVWALGCCVYEMTTLKHAFNAKDMNSLVYKILKGRMPPMPRQYGSELIALIRSMLHQDPEKRPSVNRILRDPYIKRNIAIFLEETKKSCQAGSGPRRVRVPGSAPSAHVVVPSVPVAGSATGNSEASVSPAVAPSSPSRPSSASAGMPPRAPQNASKKQETFARDELDSAAQVKNQVADSGDAPLRPNHVRRPSGALQKDLETIQEDLASAKMFDDLSSSKEDTVVPNTVKEVKNTAVEVEAKKKKKKKLLPTRNASNNQAPTKTSDPSASGDSIARTESSSLLKQERPNSARPLPLPKAEVSYGLPKKSESLSQQQKAEPVEKGTSDSTSSKSSSQSDGYAEDTPRSLPNLSARERRRQKNPSSNSLECPNSARVKLRKVPERSSSEKVTKSEKETHGKSSSSGPRRHRQQLLKDSSSSSEESGIQKGESTTEREKQRAIKEMDQFISVLDCTLKMNSGPSKSDEEKTGEVHVNGQPSLPDGRQPMRRTSSEGLMEMQTEHKTPPEQTYQAHASASMPSIETLTSTTRLTNRIRMLHRDCVQGVGYAVLKKAYDILNHIEEDEIEPKLMELLGKDKFDEYAGKIWQLKFCEDSLFIS